MTDRITQCDVVDCCEDCPRYADDCDGDKYLDRYPTMHEYAEGKRINPKLTDLISRTDAVNAVHKYFVEAFNNEPHEIDEDGDDVFTDMKSVNALLHHNKMVSKALKALPSAYVTKSCVFPQKLVTVGDYPNDLISRNALMEYCSNQKSKSIDNNDIARFPSADAVQGEWIWRTDIPIGDGRTSAGYICSNCGKDYWHGNVLDVCPNCGARMKGGDEE